MNSKTRLAPRVRVKGQNPSLRSKFCEPQGWACLERKKTEFGDKGEKD